jgi:hypothetical protein
MVALNDLTWVELLDALKNDSELYTLDIITPAPLARALRISEDSAVRLLLDIQTSAQYLHPTSGTNEEGEIAAELLYGGMTPKELAKFSHQQMRRPSSALLPDASPLPTVCIPALYFLLWLLYLCFTCMCDVFCSPYCRQSSAYHVHKACD